MGATTHSSALHLALTTIETREKEEMDNMPEDQSASNRKETSYKIKRDERQTDIQCPSFSPILISSNSNSTREDFCSYSNDPAVLDMILASHDNDSTQNNSPENGMITKFFIQEPLANNTAAQSHPKRHRSHPSNSGCSVKPRAPAGFKRHSRSSAEATYTRINSKSSRRRRLIPTSSILTTPRSIIDDKMILRTSSILPAPMAAASRYDIENTRRRVSLRRRSRHL
jgi:hypothetical protein